MEKKYITRLLLVEDTESHLVDAINIIKRLSPGIEIFTARLAEDETYKLMYEFHKRDLYKTGRLPEPGKPLVDGVITDLFMPRDKYDSELHPCGLSIASMAYKLGIPCVICTSGYHHDGDHQWIADLIHANNWEPMVDVSSWENQKPWATAYKQLLELVQGKKYYIY